MKRNLFLFVLMILFFSCKDKCKDVVCQNGGNCNDGDCVCNIGYEGTSCEKEWISPFIKTFTGKDACQTATNFTSTINKIDLLTMTISNFANRNITLTAKLEAANLVKIIKYEQAGITITGNGRWLNDTLEIAYTIVTPTNLESCTVKMW